MTMYSYTKKFTDFLTKEDFRFQYSEGVNEKYDMVELNCNCSNMPRVIFNIFFAEDGAMSLRAFNLVRFPEDKLPVMLATVNHLNNEFRFIKFTVNTDDYTVQGSVDFYFREQDDVARISFESVLRSMNICDNAYPEMMKALWS